MILRDRFGRVRGGRAPGRFRRWSADPLFRWAPGRNPPGGRCLEILLSVPDLPSLLYSALGLFLVDRLMTRLPIEP